jgi:hypothetical protein
MLTIVGQGHDGFVVELRCAVCHRRLTLMSAWMLFRRPRHGECVEGRWCHKVCADGRMHVLVGAPHALLLSAPEAFTRLAQSMNGTQP